MRVVVWIGIWVLGSGALNASTRFLDAQRRPIDAIRVVGNREIPTNEILDTLEKGPDDFNAAIHVMRHLLPYFESVEWTARLEDEKNVVTLRVREKTTGNRWRILPSGGFNRVDGVRLGMRLEMWQQPTLKRPPRGRLQGEVSYGFADREPNYELRGGFSLGRLVFTSSVYRLTDVRDEDVLPNDGEQFVLAFFFGEDFRDYYLREGWRFGVGWERAGVRWEGFYQDERHGSLRTSSEWSLFGEPEPNYPVTEGPLRNLQIRYDAEEFRPNTRRRFTIETERALGPMSFFRVAVQGRFFREVKGFRLGIRLKGVVGSKETPLQRQLFLGGPGSLRGFRRNEFHGPVGWLVNVELSWWRLWGFFDVGGTADRLSELGGAESHGNMGFGFWFGEGFRVYGAQALRRDRRPVLGVRWARSF